MIAFRNHHPATPAETCRARARSRLTRFATVTAIAAVAAGCSSAGKVVSDQRTVTVPSASTAPPTTRTGGPAPAKPAGSVPAATLPRGSAAIDGAGLLKRSKSAVFAVLSRSCRGGGYFIGSGAGIDPRFVVTSISVLSEDPSDAQAPIDPAPWIRSADRQWRRTHVVGVSEVSGLALLRVDSGYSTLPATLKWSSVPAAKGPVAILGYPGIHNGDIAALAAQVSAGGQTVTYTFPASQMGAAGLEGAPVVNAAGQIVGIHRKLASNGVSATATAASLGATEINKLAASPTEVAGRCDANSSARMPLAWGVVLAPNGGPGRAAAIGTIPKMPNLGRVGAVSSTWDGFLDGSLNEPVILGPFDTEGDANTAMSKATSLMATTKQGAPLGVQVFPVAAFAPPPAPPAFTTAKIPPTTLPPRTVRPPVTHRRTTPTTGKKGSTTTDPKKATTSNGACPPAGKRRLATISGGKSGLSVTMRSGPSASAKGVRLAANGYRVSVVVGSSTGGFSEVVLPESPPVCVWVPNQYLR